MNNPLRRLESELVVFTSQYMLPLPFVTALRVQMSSYTADMLQVIGGFNLQCRGEIQVKVSHARSLECRGEIQVKVSHAMGITS